MPHLRIGQFSRSPVLVAARRLGWDTAEGLTLDISPVPSSPAQFASLRDGEIDVALTSPDNVLLYATTDKNPVGSRIPVVIHRGVDGGLGLGLVARPEISEPEGLIEVPIAVDVLQSGFAMLLKAMISRLGVDPARLTFVEEGATPKRADRLIEGAVGATILNAESRVRAEAQGMRVWSTSSDISKNYPGTVLASLDDGPDLSPLLRMWDRTTAWLLDAPAREVQEVIGQDHAELGSREYIDIMRTEPTGLRRHARVTAEELEVLVTLREEAGAYTPTRQDLRTLALE